MRRLLTLLLAAAGATAAARVVARKRASGSASQSGPSVMPRPTAPPAPASTTREDPVPDTPDSESPETPGPIDEGEPGAITAAPVPEEPEPAPPPRPDDAELERAVESEIAEDPAVPHEDVEVEVEHGVAQLRGTVPDEETAARLGDDAAHVDGVIGIDDRLERGGSAEEPAPGAAARDPEQTDD